MIGHISGSPRKQEQEQEQAQVESQRLAKQCGFFSPCIIYGISGLAVYAVYACHVRPTD